MLTPLIVIAGPTGIGKTGVAIEIAENTGGEIVGADSMQIYRYMDIGTAKPTPAERARIPHHLIDIRDPDEAYSAADYAREATAAIQDIRTRGKIPLMVGGTGLYIHTVLYGVFHGPGRDDTLRAKMRQLADEHGTPYLYQQLVHLDPETANRIHPNDRVRIIRALEVFQITGMPISQHQASATTPLEQYDSCFLVLTAKRENLYARINARVEQMLATGFMEEVQDLLQRGYGENLNPMNSLGYKEMTEFLSGKRERSETIELIKRNTRRYAKRQLTWFRKYQGVSWIWREPTESVKETAERCMQVISPWQSR